MKLLTSAFIALNVWLYRLSGGRVMGRMAGAPILLLTTTGRRSRRERTVPVLYLEDGGRFVMVASIAGAPQNPAWFLNLYLRNLSGKISAFRPAFRAFSFAPNRSVAARRGLSAM